MRAILIGVFSMMMVACGSSVDLPPDEVSDSGQAVTPPEAGSQDSARSEVVAPPDTSVDSVGDAPDAADTAMTPETTPDTAMVETAVPPDVGGPETADAPVEVSSDAEAGADTADTGPPPSVCGNGIVEAGEECDDGNTLSCDGCESCQKRMVESKSSVTTADASAVVPEAVSVCVEMWMRRWTPPATGEAFFITEKNSLGLFASSDGGGGTFITARITGTAKMTFSALITTGVWHHIAACRWVDTSSGEARYYLDLFVDGQMSETSLSYVPVVPGTLLPGSLNIGNANSDLDEIRITKGRTYDKNFVPARRFSVDASTLALWHFDGNGHDSGPTNLTASPTGSPVTYAADTGYVAAMCL